MRFPRKQNPTSFSKMADIFFRKEFLHAMVPFCGCLNFGYTQGWWSPLSSIISYSLVNDTKVITSDQFTTQYDTWFPAISSLFALFGPFFYNFLGRWFSRSKTFMILCILNAVFWATFIPFWIGGKHYKNAYAWLMINRALIGFITGAFSSISPVMLVELAPSNCKDVYGTFNQFGIVVGICLCDFVGEAKESTVHLGICLLAIATSIVGALGTFVIPDTAGPTKDDVGKVEESGAPNEKPWDRKYIKGLFIGAMMMFFQQFCGVNAFLNNLKDIFTSANLNAGGFTSNIQAAVATFAQNVAIFVSFFFMERLGIYVFWALSSVVIAVCVFIYGFQLRFFPDVAWLPVVLLFVYMLGFGAAYGPIPWFVVQSLFPPHVVPLASSIIACVNWVLAFLMVFLFPFLKKDNVLKLQGCCFLFGCVAVCGFVFGLFYVPKKGQTNKSTEIKVEELDEP